MLAPRQAAAEYAGEALIGLLAGIAFGFLLQKGGATKYDVIIGQLLFTDFTVLEIMLSAVVTATVGVHLLRRLGLARLQPKPGSVGSSVIGALIFGVGFGVFFGESMAVLRPVADGFIRLLQMAVLPYVVASLITGLVRSDLQGEVTLRYPETGADHRLRMVFDVAGGSIRG